MDPSSWGPYAWDLIHSVAFNVASREPRERQEPYNQAKHIFYSFLYILPCAKCRKNYHQHMMCLPIPDDAADLPKWTYQMHKRISGQDFLWTAAKRKWQDHPLTLTNIMPFLESIAETHPSARNIDAVYRDNLFNFMKGVDYFYGNGVGVTKDEVTSRHLLKMRLRKMKTRLGINTPHNLMKCSRKPTSGNSCY